MCNSRADITPEVRCVHTGYCTVGNIADKACQ